MSNTNQTDLEILIATQLRLQTERMKDGNPQHLVGDTRADFIRWNMLALEDELHEALAECGWKPWASSRHINREPFMKEMVDAFHFFMNLLIVVSPGMDPAEIATEFAELYYAKNKVNADRQVQGYDGVTTKCPNCKRELDEVDSEYIVEFHDRIFCTEGCALEFNAREELDHRKN